LSDTTLGFLVVAVAYVLIIAGGLGTGTMLLPPILSFRRNEDPGSFWLAAAANLVLASLAMFVAVANR
jgi:hypothetical protein